MLRPRPCSVEVAPAGQLLKPNSETRMPKLTKMPKINVFCLFKMKEFQNFSSI